MEDKVHLTITGMTIVVTGEVPEWYLEFDTEPRKSWHGIFIDTRYEVIETSSGVKEITSLPAYRDVTCSDMAVIGDAAVDRVADPLFIAGGQGGTVIGNRFHRNFVYSTNTGTIKVSNVDLITNNGGSKLAIFDQVNSAVTVERVTLEGDSNIGVWVRGNTNTTFNVSRLNVNGCPGVAFDANPACTLSLIHCDMKHMADSYWAAIEIWDDYGTNNIVISNNKIHSEDVWLWGPIFAEGVPDGVITNNKITGRGPSVIHLGVLDWFPGSVTLKGNNLNGWETTPDPWGLNTAPIWLGPYITDSVVVGGKNKVNIFDEPEYDYSYPDWWNHPLPPDANGNVQTYDENGNIVPKNNIFTGVNNMHLNIGQNVREAMKQKVEAKKAMMSRGGKLRQ